MNSAKWLGKCPSCSEWNTFVEELLSTTSQRPEWSIPGSANRAVKPQLIQEIPADRGERFSSGDEELDRVLGGGIVNGSLVLIGGDPGIGKSTLMLQVAIQLHKRILYVSGEESPQQIKMRADRMGISSRSCYLLPETSLSEIFNHVAGSAPEMMIIDSIQTIRSSHLDAAPGSVSQVRECAGQLMRYAKESNVPVFLIGHINKEGSIAGPKVLEHMVDTVLQFEGDRHHMYRILRTSKNRFGSTSELGIYEMVRDGLRQVKNPSEILLSTTDITPGVAVGAVIEGNRPLLVEVQALVSPAAYGTPQRSTTGFDVKRLHMLLAVLEKRIGLRLSAQDVFVNITGGLRIDDPSMDLAVCAAICSSYHDISIDRKNCFIGEVGLGGEIRAVRRVDMRLKEGDKLGFKSFYVANSDQNGFSGKLEINKNTLLKETFGQLFG